MTDPLITVARFLAEHLECSIAECTKSTIARGWCSTHYERWRRTGNPELVLPNPAMLPGSGNAKWLGSQVKYRSAHDRVRKARGLASDYACVDCGGSAIQWSYDHQDPDELIEPDDPKRKPYSANPEHYEPRCRPCHWRKDHPTGKPTRT